MTLATCVPCVIRCHAKGHGFALTPYIDIRCRHLISLRMNNTWIGTDEAAEYLGMGKTKLYELTRGGRIPAKRVGKKWMYGRDELAEWDAGQPAT